ncbi:hypothetical protein [Legionella fallonii]|uniref:Uncharacterized protein n=1 Tax=Legionella fallonii LLAP-10 TaxID=1212491 RepID=A0A098G837_9GAMM|nr:hypothetical protein [Legionella fallonii]CEG58643.1 protein of unknown function [Legionella fallonii LLAP-10]
MSKHKTKEQASEYYQQKGFDLHDQLQEFDGVANNTNKRNCKVIQQQLQVQKELESWEQKLKKTPSKQLIAKKLDQLQKEHYKELHPFERVYILLLDDYVRQNFNGKGKKLLLEEIEKLERNTKKFSFLNNANTKNKQLLRTMKSIVVKLEELEKLQQELSKQFSRERKVEVKKQDIPSKNKQEKLDQDIDGPASGIKEQESSDRETFFSKHVRKNAMIECDLSTPMEIDEIDELAETLASCKV